MSATKKPRSDSKLKTLPEERQAAIAAKLREKSLEEVRTWLREDGIETSLPALSDFFSWYQLRQQHQQNESDVETLLQLLKKEQPTLSGDQLFNYGQQLFSLLSIKSQDSKEWARIQKLNLTNEVIENERKKIAQRLQTDIEKALAAFYDVAKQHPAVLAAYHTLEAEVKKATAQ